MAVYGWESPKPAALYTRKANRKRLAESAMHLLVPERKTDEAVTHQASQPAGKTGFRKASD